MRRILPALCVLPLGTAVFADAPDIESAFQLTIDAYQNAGALVDRMDYTVHMPGAEPHEDGFTITFGPGDLVGVDFGSLLALSRDGRFYFAGADADDPYLEAEFQEGFDATLQRLLGGAVRIPSPPHVFMRNGASIESVLGAFGFGLIGQPELVALEETHLDGKTFDRFIAESGTGRLEMFVHPETHFVRRMNVEAAAGPSPDHGRIRADIRFQPKNDASTNTIREFTTDGRMRVDSINQLMNAGPKVGAEAPELTFQHPGGDTFNLSELRGKVIVLDFWATWCGNCFISLPQLQKVADWAEAEDLDITFLAVNSQEEIEDPSERVNTARRWWNKLDLELPWVIDVDNNASIALRASSFPALIVIDQEGVVAYAHSGFDKDLEEHLRSKLAALTQAR